MDTTRADEHLYRLYVAHCLRLGIKPVPRKRAKELLHEWERLGALSLDTTDHPRSVH